MPRCAGDNRGSMARRARQRGVPLSRDREGGLSCCLDGDMSGRSDVRKAGRRPGSPAGIYTGLRGYWVSSFTPPFRVQAGGACLPAPGVPGRRRAAWFAGRRGRAGPAPWSVRHGTRLAAFNDQSGRTNAAGRIDDRGVALDQVVVEVTDGGEMLLLGADGHGPWGLLLTKPREGRKRLDVAGDVPRCRRCDREAERAEVAHEPANGTGIRDPAERTDADDELLPRKSFASGGNGLTTAHNRKGMTHDTAKEALDDLSSLHGFNEQTDRRLVRRDLQPEEVARILEVASEGESVFVERPYRTDSKERKTALVRMTVPNRAWAYRVAAETGFRASEISSLSPESFDLTANPPTVTVSAAYSKHKRMDVQPIRSEFADSLRGFLKGKKRGERLFPLPPKKAALLIRADLEVARARWIAEAPDEASRAKRQDSDFLRHTDRQGRVVDFHGLRHTFI